jgi:hypothetical protein
MKLLSFYFVFLFSFCSHATYLEIEDDGDIKRVYNTIHHFWHDHHQQMECFEESLKKGYVSLENEQSKESLRQIKSSKHNLVRLAKKDPSQFLSDLDADIKYIQENEELLAEKDIVYVLFYKEIILLKLVLLSLIH